MKPKIGLDQCHGACTVFMNLQLQNPAHGFCAGRWPLHPDKAQNSSWIYLDGHWSDEAPYIVGCNAMQTKGFNRSYCTVVKVSEKAFAAPGKDPSAVICNQTFCGSHHTCPCSFWLPEQSCGDFLCPLEIGKRS